jgi:hypothetical protein
MTVKAVVGLLNDDDKGKSAKLTDCLVWHAIGKTYQRFFKIKYDE